MTSPNGVNWTGRTAAEANQWINACWSPKLRIFCAVANTGTNRCMTSGVDKLQITSAANGAVAKTFTASQGPTGAQTAVQGWLRINVAGVDRFIPYW